MVCTVYSADLAALIDRHTSCHDLEGRAVPARTVPRDSLLSSRHSNEDPVQYMHMYTGRKLSCSLSTEQNLLRLKLWFHVQ